MSKRHPTFRSNTPPHPARDARGCGSSFAGSPKYRQHHPTRRKQARYAAHMLTLAVRVSGTDFDVSQNARNQVTTEGEWRQLLLETRRENL